VDNYTLAWVSGPETELLTLAEAKDHLRVTTETEVQVVQEKLRAARMAIEGEIGKPIGEQVFEMKLRCWPWWVLRFPRLPFIEIVSITYEVNDDSLSPAEQTITFYNPAASPPVDPATFTVHSGGDFYYGELNLKSGETWPDETLAYGWPITVRFKAGVTTLRPNLRSAWLLMLGHLWEHREAVTEGAMAELPLAIRSLCASETVDSIA